MARKKVYKPTMKDLGRALIKGSGKRVQPGQTIKTGRSKKVALDPADKILETPELQVYRLKGGWSRVILNETGAANPVEFSVRTNRISKEVGTIQRSQAREAKAATRKARYTQPGQVRKFGRSDKVDLDAADLIVDEPRLKVYKLKGGWSRVVYTDPAAAGPVEFSIRTKEIAEELKAMDTIWKVKPERVYSKWINTTAAGKTYVERRRVEGMLKVAIKRGDTALEEEIRKVLEGSDEAVAAWRMRWLMDKSDIEIAEFYDYDEDDLEDGQAKPTDDDLWS